jgi:hypothetical protein
MRFPRLIGDNFMSDLFHRRIGTESGAIGAPAGSCFRAAKGMKKAGSAATRRRFPA